MCFRIFVRMWWNSARKKRREKGERKKENEWIAKLLLLSLHLEGKEKRNRRKKKIRAKQTNKQTNQSLLPFLHSFFLLFPVRVDISPSAPLCCFQKSSFFSLFLNFFSVIFICCCCYCLFGWLSTPRGSFILINVLFFSLAGLGCGVVFYMFRTAAVSSSFLLLLLCS